MNFFSTLMTYISDPFKSVLNVLTDQLDQVFLGFLYDVVWFVTTFVIPFLSWLTTAGLNYYYFLPEYFLATISFLILLTNLWISKQGYLAQIELVKKFLIAILFFIVFNLFLIVYSYDFFLVSRVASWGNFYTTTFLYEIKLALLTGFLILYWIYMASFEKIFQSKILVEQFAITLISLFFAFLMISSLNLVVLGLSLTGLNICFYILIAQPKTINTLESASKYFIIGMFVLFFYFLGVWMLWLEYGTVNIATMVVIGGLDPQITYLSSFALFLITFALLIKVSTFPNHFWAIDVYSGASLYVVAMLVLIAKSASLCTLINIYTSFEAHKISYLNTILCILGAGSAIFGTFGAIRQQRIKRFLAYSSINHFGYILVGLGSTTESTMFAVKGYFIFYLIANIILFGVLLGIRKENAREITYLTELAAVVKSNPFIGFIFLTIFFSFAGLPPFTGFLTKYAILSVCFDSGQFIYLLILFILIGFAAYNYLRVIKNMYFRLPNNPSSQFIYSWPAYSKFILFLTSLFLLPTGFGGLIYFLY